MTSASQRLSLYERLGGIGGELAWRQHDGGHTNVPNFPAFYEWAGRYIPTPGLKKEEERLPGHREACRIPGAGHGGPCLGRQ